MSLKGFNLLQGNTAPPDAWDMVYAWVTQVGRVIVIVVELIVILAFGARVVIDTQGKNLLEAEKQNSTRLTAFKQKELQFLDRQQRFSAYKGIWDLSSTYTAATREIVKSMPRDVEELSISIRDNVVTYKGIARTSDISTFETALKNATTLFSDVLVLEVESEGSGTGARARSSFGIKIEIKPEILAARQKFATTTTPAATPATTTPTNTTR
jgi:hypothetical protein